MKAFVKKVAKAYYDLCRQSSLAFRTQERLHPRIWHKDYIVLRFINRSIITAMKQYGLSHKDVLDLGCFHKPYEALFNSSRYYGVDYFNNNEADKTADLNEVLDLGEQFDLTACLDTMEHVLKTDNLIETMNRNTKSGGYLIITTPFLFPVHDAPYDYHRFTEYFYRDFPSTHFKLLSVSPSNTYLASLVIHANYFFYRIPIPYFLKYPLYFIVNVKALVIDLISKMIARVFPMRWFKEFMWSGPLEYFAIYIKS